LFDFLSQTKKIAFDFYFSFFFIIRKKEKPKKKKLFRGVWRDREIFILVIHISSHLGWRVDRLKIDLCKDNLDVSEGEDMRKSLSVFTEQDLILVD
jgi:hypothetical protein